MNGNGDERTHTTPSLEQLAAAGVVELGGQPAAVEVRRQVIEAPLQTEAEAVAAGQLEISHLVMDGGEPTARTFRLGAAGIEALRAALTALDALGGEEPPTPPPTPPEG